MYVVDNQEDFARYFTGTYIARMEKDVMQPYYVREGTGAARIDLRKCVQVDGAIGDPVAMRFVEILDNFKLTMPRLGNISTMYGLANASASPQRQYFKGLTDRRIRYISMTGLKEDARLVDPIVFCIYNNRMFNGEELLAMIREGVRVGGAISHKLGLYIKPKIKFPMLSYKTSVMGVIENDTDIKVLKRFEEYEDYVLKYFPNRNIKIWKP